MKILLSCLLIVSAALVMGEVELWRWILGGLCLMVAGAVFWSTLSHE